MTARSDVAPVSAGRVLALSAPVMLVAAIFGLTYSLTAPLIALDMARRGSGESLIGLNAAMHAGGVLLVAPVLPRLSVRYGTRGLIVGALLVSGAVLLLFPQMRALWTWFPLRLLLGMAAEVLFVLTETWTNDLCTDGVRGRTMAIYTAALSLGMVGGPAILSSLGPRPVAFAVGAGIAVLAIPFVVGPWAVPPANTEPTASNPLQYVRLAPVAIAVTVLNAAVETAGLSFIGLFAAGHGWSEGQGLRLVSTLMLGAIVLQLPIGWLADKLPPRQLALGLAVASALGALVWPSALGNAPLAFAVVFVWGGLFVGIYTVMLTMVGSRFSGGDLVGIYAVMGLAWGAGAFVGPSLAGVAMHLSPARGLPTFVAVACGVFAAFMALTRRET